MKPSPHRLNREFSWEPHRGPFRRVSDAQARAFDEQGFFVLEDAFDLDAVREITETLDALEAKTEAFLQTREGGRLGIARAGEITFTPHAVRRPEVRAFCTGPVFRDLCHDLIGPNVRLYWDQAVYKKPGTEASFPWHQDNGYTYIEPQQYLTCWVALTDANESTGCPWVVPGLHLQGTLAHEPSDLGYVCLKDPADAVPTPARAGSIVVFSSLTPHATGPNSSDEIRKAYIVQFAPDGAEILLPDGAHGVRRQRANEADRQFPILVAGHGVN